ncbi:MAG: tRNA (guanosine(37)-N1)-methyltransferase TrmD [Candidatus Magasanikbacteria bacterium]
MKFNVVTIFPDIINSYCNESILKRGQKARAIHICAINLRDFAEDKHQKVDDTPYGGGPGMVMKPDVIFKCLHSLDAIPFRKSDAITKMKRIFGGGIKKKKRTVLLSPRGRQFDQRITEQWSKLDELTLVCGRYEGVDQRVADYMVDEEISVGPYVLAGGELGALVIVEAIARLIPGVLGNEESLNEETFNTEALQHYSTTADTNKQSVQVKEYAQYTKPVDFRGWKVPEVLLNGDHKRIKEWREKQR